jgi:class 3 adenylate cyclase
MVVSDLKGSTALAERLDSETLRAVLGRYFDEMGVVLESHGGGIAKIIGDAIVAVFDGGHDPARAARRATRAAVEAQVALTWLNDRFDATWGVRLENRTGVASGELPAVDAQDGQADDVLTSDVLTTAESLEAAAPTMEVLIDDRTRALIGGVATTAPVPVVRRRHGSKTIEAWQLISVRAPREDVGPERPAGAARLCDDCGAANGHDARWCDACGSALATGDTARESRRMVTILFADPQVTGADDVLPTAAAAQAAMTRYFTVMRPILERHGATVEKFIGDATMAVFGLPVRHEDDALRAVRAAVDMRAV